MQARRVDRIGIIAEGRADLAVLCNILKGELDLDRANVQFLRPEYDQDETDLAEMPPEQRGSYLLVIEECKKRTKIADFLGVIAEERLVIIHLDSAESYRSEYGLAPPEGTEDEGPSAVESLRSRIIDKINEWVGHNHGDQLRYAIAVQETDAWLLTIYDDTHRKDTSCHRDAKSRLEERVLPRKRKDIKRLNQLGEFKKYDELSRDFRKKKLLRACARRNQSLLLFCDSLSAALPDEI